MSKLLYVQASPRVERSHSRGVADAFVRGYAEKHPRDEITTVDLFNAELPAMDNLTVQGKYNIMHGKGVQATERQAWNQVEKVIADFTGADKYVFAVPMWNFGIPYRLKHYIDLAACRTSRFEFS